MKGADVLLRRPALTRGVDTIFGYPGGAIMPVYDALLGVRHPAHPGPPRAGAAFAADGYARVSGRPASASRLPVPARRIWSPASPMPILDSVPMIAITGQVATPLMGTDAFQEVDIFGMTLPIVKHSYIARHVEDLPRIVDEAWRIATSGRPGPVLIDLPKDIAARRGARRCRRTRRLPATARAAESEPARRAQPALIAAAERPVIYAGGGIGIGRADEGVPHSSSRRPASRSCSTLKGLGAVPTDHPLFLGHAGHARHARREHAPCRNRSADRASARASTIARPASSTDSRRTRASSTWTSTRPKSASCATPTWRCAATCRASLEALPSRRPRIAALAAALPRAQGASTRWRYDAPGEASTRRSCCGACRRPRTAS